ncbi:efflux RND transporter permease subunit, partial [Pseudomonas aeruginosa]
ERIMAEEHLSPKEATRKAMGQISGAIIGITLVLTAVFVPMAFFPGAVGIIYQQFSLTMVVSILFSGFLALSLTPALCASFLKPIKAGHHEKKGFFGWFNRTFARSAKSYEGWVARLLKRSVLMIGVYLAVIAGAVVVFRGLPTSFLPTEDQGYFIVNVQLPPGAAKERTLEVMKQVEEAVLPQPEVANMVSVLGFSFSGQGQNAALAFVPLKDWSERKG